LILEGKLFAPWITDLGTAFEKFRANFQNREPVIGLKNLTAISQEGEYVLLEVDDGGSIPLRRVYQTYLEHCHCHPAIKRDMIPNRISKRTEDFESSAQVPTREHSSGTKILPQDRIERRDNRVL
jgi:hypothetical protein